jgi:hypothetical protein
VILGFYAGKSHKLIGLGIFHGDLDFFDLHEKSLDLSDYEIFPHNSYKWRLHFLIQIIVLAACLQKNWQLCIQLAASGAKFAWLSHPQFQRIFQTFFSLEK